MGSGQTKPQDLNYKTLINPNYQKTFEQYASDPQQFQQLAKIKTKKSLIMLLNGEKHKSNLVYQQSIGSAAIQKCIGIYLYHSIGSSIGVIHQNNLKIDKEGFLLSESLDKQIQFIQRYKDSNPQITTYTSYMQAVSDSFLSNGQYINMDDILFRFSLYYSKQLGANIYSNIQGNRFENIIKNYISDPKTQPPEDENFNSSQELTYVFPAAIINHQDIIRAEAMAMSLTSMTCAGKVTLELSRLLAHIIVKLLQYQGNNPKSVLENLPASFITDNQDVKHLVESRQQKLDQINQFNVTDDDRNWNWREQYLKLSPTRFQDQQNIYLRGLYSMDAMYIALHIVYKYNSPEKCIKQTRVIEANSTVLCSIVGALSGAMYGIQQQDYNLYMQQFGDLESYNQILFPYLLYNNIQLSQYLQTYTSANETSRIFKKKKQSFMSTIQLLYENGQSMAKQPLKQSNQSQQIQDFNQSRNLQKQQQDYGQQENQAQFQNNFASSHLLQTILQQKEQQELIQLGSQDYQKQTDKLSQIFEYRLSDLQKNINNLHNKYFPNYRIISKQDRDLYLIKETFSSPQNLQNFIRNDIKLSKCIASFLGNAIGDALGAHTEFETFIPHNIILSQNSWQGIENFVQYKMNSNLKYRQRTYIGVITDDCSMGKCMADSILANSMKFNALDMKIRFILWWYTGYNNGSVDKSSFGLGGNIHQGFKEFFQNQQPLMADIRQMGYVNGNGSIMRLSPIPIAYHDNISHALNIAKYQSLVTHDGKEAADCCAMLTFLLIKLLNTQTNLTSKSLPQILEYYKPMTESVSYLKMSQREPSGSYKKYDQKFNKVDEDRDWDWKNKTFVPSSTRLNQNAVYFGSYCMDGCKVALHIVYNSSSFEEGVFKAVNWGGDSDSIAAMVGYISGALYGLNEQLLALYFEKMYKYDQLNIPTTAFKLYNKIPVQTPHYQRKEGNIII